MTTCMFCLNCKDYSETSDLKIVEKSGKKITSFYLQGTCGNSSCNKTKSTRIGKVLPSGYSLESKPEELKALLKPKKDVKIHAGTGLINSVTEDIITAAVATEAAEKDGEGFLDELGDVGAKVTKSLARRIPVVGDLLVDTGIVDKGIDLFSEHVWQPIKKYFGNSLALDDKNNDKALSDLVQQAMELRIKSGDGIVPKYLGELRNGSPEDRALAHVLMKTVTKPKFYKYLKDEKIPSTMSILEAMIKYKSRDKSMNETLGIVNDDEQKSLNILKDLGYENV